MSIAIRIKKFWKDLDIFAKLAVIAIFCFLLLVAFGALEGTSKFYKEQEHVLPGYSNNVESIKVIERDSYDGENDNFMTDISISDQVSSIHKARNNFTSSPKHILQKGKKIINFESEEFIRSVIKSNLNRAEFWDGNTYAISDWGMEEVLVGDTIYSVSKRFNLPVNTVLRLNNISFKEKLSPGKKLLLFKGRKDVWSDDLKDNSRSLVSIKDFNGDDISIGSAIILPKGNITLSLIRFEFLSDYRLFSQPADKLLELGEAGAVFKDSKGKTRSVADGIILFTGLLDGYGHSILVKHPRDYFSLYYGIDLIGLKKGDIVREGQIIGKISSTNKLYFEIRKNIMLLELKKFWNSN